MPSAACTKQVLHVNSVFQPVRKQFHVDQLDERDDVKASRRVDRGKDPRRQRVIWFFFLCYGDNRDLHSFPTRRSSDLSARSPGTSSATNAFGFTQTICGAPRTRDRKSTRLNSSHVAISDAVFCLKKKNNPNNVPFFFKKKKKKPETTS